MNASKIHYVKSTENHQKVKFEKKRYIYHVSQEENNLYMKPKTCWSSLTLCFFFCDLLKNVIFAFTILTPLCFASLIPLQFITVYYYNHLCRNALPLGLSLHDSASIVTYHSTFEEIFYSESFAVSLNPVMCYLWLAKACLTLNARKKIKQNK